jgi:hypothetical protein
MEPDDFDPSEKFFTHFSQTFPGDVSAPGLFSSSTSIDPILWPEFSTPPPQHFRACYNWL